MAYGDKLYQRPRPCASPELTAKGAWRLFPWSRGKQAAASRFSRSAGLRLPARLLHAGLGNPKKDRHEVAKARRYKSQSRYSPKVCRIACAIGAKGSSGPLNIRLWQIAPASRRSGLAHPIEPPAPGWHRVRGLAPATAAAPGSAQPIAGRADADRKSQHHIGLVGIRTRIAEGAHPLRREQPHSVQLAAVGEHREQARRAAGVKDSSRARNA